MLYFNVFFWFRTQANFIIWRIVDYAADKFKSPLKIYKFQLNSAINGGQLDREQVWKECIGVVKAELPYAIGYNFIANDNFGLKNSSLELFNKIKDEFTTLIKQAKWIDDSIRGMLLNKLRALSPLIAYPSDGFSETEISAFYSEITIDTDQYLRTLFALRIIDADNNFRQTKPDATSSLHHSNIDNWRKYLPPTSLVAFYSASDNTLRK
jgi:predicted metalloendopeptidase